jgi:hypothetical protein
MKLLLVTKVIFSSSVKDNNSIISHDPRISEESIEQIDSNL